MFTLGRWQFPLSSGRVELLREGRPFWEVLEGHGIETTIVRMPANFPPSGKATRELSGMGTPDVLGTYGTFSFFTSAPGADCRRCRSTKSNATSVAGPIICCRTRCPAEL